MIASLLLTAGLSSRFGSPKALAEIAGQTVIERLQEELLTSHSDEIIIVTGANRRQIEPCLFKHKRIRFVYNKDYNFGQTSSFQAGLRALDPRTKGVLLLPVDYPGITSEIINRVIGKFKSGADRIVIPSYLGRKGHPPLFPVALQGEFLSLDMSEGINRVAQCHAEETDILAVDDPGILMTFNTQEEFELVKREIIRTR